MSDVTAEIITQFKGIYPLFNDPTMWPDIITTQALCFGSSETGGKRWGVYLDDCHNIKQRGMFLYAAHWLVSTYPSGAADASKQAPTAKNIVNSKSVGDESISFSVAQLSNVNQSGDGWLASTAFGQQFIALRRRVGMGATAV